MLLRLTNTERSSIWVNTLGINCENIFWHLLFLRRTVILDHMPCYNRHFYRPMKPFYLLVQKIARSYVRSILKSWSLPLKSIYLGPYYRGPL